MKNKLLYLLLTVLLATVVMACSSGTEEIIPEATPKYRADLMLRADAGNGEVKLDWLMDPYAETYNIYVGTSRNSLTKVATGVISASFTIDGLTNNTIYFFSVSGENENGESELATPITAIPLANPRPLAPENVRANAGNQQVTVTWTPVDGVDGYTVYCTWQTSATDLGGGYVTVAGQSTASQIVNGSTITEWVYNTGEDYLVNGRTYTFWVASIKDEIESTGSFPAYATPTATPPPMAPTNLTANTGVPGCEEIYLNWDDVAGATSYNVYISEAKNIRKDIINEYNLINPANPYWGKIEGPTGSPPDSGFCTVGLPDDVPFYFVVTAVNANGESAESNEWWAILSATTPFSGSLTSAPSGSLTITAH